MTAEELRKKDHHGGHKWRHGINRHKIQSNKRTSGLKNVTKESCFLCVITTMLEKVLTSKKWAERDITASFQEDEKSRVGYCQVLNFLEVELHSFDFHSKLNHYFGRKVVLNKQNPREIDTIREMDNMVNAKQDECNTCKITAGFNKVTLMKNETKNIQERAKPKYVRFLNSIDERKENTGGVTEAGIEAPMVGKETETIELTFIDVDTDVSNTISSKSGEELYLSENSFTRGKGLRNESPLKHCYSTPELTGVGNEELFGVFETLYVGSPSGGEYFNSLPKYELDYGSIQETETLCSSIESSLGLHAFVETSRNHSKPTIEISTIDEEYGNEKTGLLNRVSKLEENVAQLTKALKMESTDLRCQFYNEPLPEPFVFANGGDCWLRGHDHVWECMAQLTYLDWACRSELAYLTQKKCDVDWLKGVALSWGPMISNDKYMF